MSFDVAGERTDLLQVVLPEEEAEGDHSGKSEEGDHGDQMGEEYDVALTAEAAEALNEVAGDDAFAEGDVSATTDDGNTAEQLTRVKGAGGRQAADAVVGSWLTGSMRPLRADRPGVGFEISVVESAAGTRNWRGGVVNTEPCRCRSWGVP